MTLCRDVSRSNKPDNGDSVCILFLSFISSEGWLHELETYWNWHYNSYTQELLPCSILSCLKMNKNLALPVWDGWSFTGTCTLLTWRARWFLSQNILEKAPLATACNRAGTFKNIWQVIGKTTCPSSTIKSLAPMEPVGKSNFYQSQSEKINQPHMVSHLRFLRICALEAVLKEQHNILRDDHSSIIELKVEAPKTTGVFFLS